MKKFLSILSLIMLCSSPVSARLIKLSQLIPTIRLDIRYATTNNFTGKRVYPLAGCYLEEAAAQALAAAQADFLKLGYGLLVFDGYRPLAVQKIFWDILPDPNYVADPAKGSRHNRGCAVDVTLVDLKTGQPLSMGTEFDDFTKRAHRTCTDLPSEVLSNRKLLEDIMHKHGFIGWVCEWWHFDYKGWEDYPILDISFEELEQR